MNITITAIGQDYLVLAPHTLGVVGFRFSALAGFEPHVNHETHIILVSGERLTTTATCQDLIDALSPSTEPEPDPTPEQLQQEAEARRARAKYLLERSA